MSMDLEARWNELGSQSKVVCDAAMDWFRCHLDQQDVWEFLAEHLKVRSDRKTLFTCPKRRALDLALRFYFEFPALKRALLSNLEPDGEKGCMLYVLRSRRLPAALRDKEIREAVKNIALDREQMVRVRQQAIVSLRPAAMLDTKLGDTLSRALSDEANTELYGALESLRGACMSIPA